MNFKLPFSYENSIEDPNIIIRNRELKNVGTIVNVQDFEFVIRFNSFWELSFTVYKELNGVVCPYWDKIKDLKIVYIEELNRNFVITVSEDESNELIKHVTGTSLCENELSNSKLNNIEINTAEDILRDDYITPTILYNENNKDASLLHRLLDKVPHYTIGHVDDQLKKIQRSFSFDDISVYDAFNEIAEKIGCLFDFDSNERIINVYDLMNYCTECGERFEVKSKTCPNCGSQFVINGKGNDTIITVSRENIATMLSVDPMLDEYKNKLRVKTGDELLDATIRNINPTGNEYIYSFDEVDLEDMPDELVQKIKDYNTMYENYIKSYVFKPTDSSLTTKYNQLVQKYNADKYRYYIFNDDGEKMLINNSYKQITSETGYDNFAKLSYDNIDFQYYLQSSLLPTVTNDYTIDDDVKELTANNLSPTGISDLNLNTSKASVEAYIKKYIPLYLHNSYSISFEGSSYDYEGERSDHYLYGQWEGYIVLTEYGTDGETRRSGYLRITVTNNLQNVYQQNILKQIKSQDNSVGNIYDLISITNITTFKDAITYYSLDQLSSYADAFQNGLDVAIEAGLGSSSSSLYNTLYVPYNEKLKAIKAEITLRNQEINTILEVADEIEKQKVLTQKALNFEAYVGRDLWKLLCAYIREDTYSVDTFSSEGLTNAQVIELAQEILDEAKEKSKQIGYIQKSISGSLIQFMSLPEFQSYTGDFNLGNWMRVEIDDKGYLLRFIEATVSISNGEVTVSPTFSEVERKENELSDVKKLLDNMSSLATSIGEITSSIETQKSNSNFIKDLRKYGLDLTKMKIFSDPNKQDVVFDSNGILVRSYDDVNDVYSPTQLRIVNSTIAITDDAWETIKTAIGGFYFTDPLTNETRFVYGINGEVLVGELIVGSNLIITTENNSFTMSEDGLIINTTSKMKNRSLFRIQKDGVDKLYINSDGDVVGNDITMNNLTANSGTFTGEIYATKGEIGGMTISNNAIYSGTKSMSDNTAGIYVGTAGIRGYTDATHYFNLAKGTLTATGVTITGAITANTGYIGGTSGFTITSGKLYSNNKNTLNSTASGVYIGTDGISIGNGFKVTSAGKLSAVDGVFSGSIESTSGTIGGFDINADRLCTSFGADDDNLYLMSDPPAVLFRSNINGKNTITEYSPRGLAVYDSTSITDYYSGIYLGGIEYDFDGSDSSIHINSVKYISLDATTYIYVNSSKTYFQSTIDVSSNIVAGGYVYAGETLYMGYNEKNEAPSMAVGVGTYWADASPHRIIERGSNGLNSSFGWAGDTTYRTTAILRGNSVRLSSATGEVVSSDRNLKTDFIDLRDERYDVFFDNLEPTSYRYILGTSNRHHFGFITQKVEEALAKAGLTTQDFGGVSITTNIERETEQDENGKIVDIFGSTNNYLLDHGINERHDLIYSEFIALLTVQIQKLKPQVKANSETLGFYSKRIDENARRIEELETRVRYLEGIMMREGIIA